MVLAEIIAVGLIFGLLRGGTLKHVLSEPLTGEWILLVLLPLQMLWPSISRRAGLGCGISVVAWLAMMGVLAAVLFLNSRSRWMLAFAGLGIAMNVLAIGLNGAMPVSIKATSEIGIPRVAARAALEADCLHEELTDSSRLVVLADVIAVPGPRWQRGVLSIGDLLLALGLAAWLAEVSRGSPTAAT